MTRTALLSALGIGLYATALYWLAAVSDPRCKRFPSDSPALEIERLFPKDCAAAARQG